MSTPYRNDLEDLWKSLTECTTCGGDASIRGATFALRSDKPAVTLCRQCLEMIAEMEAEGPDHGEDFEPEIYEAQPDHDADDPYDPFDGE